MWWLCKEPLLARTAYSVVCQDTGPFAVKQAMKVSLEDMLVVKCPSLRSAPPPPRKKGASMLEDLRKCIHEKLVHMYPSRTPPIP